MRSIEQLDRWISGKLKTWSSQVSGAPQSGDLLAIRRDVLEEIRDHIAPAGNGRNVFPYHGITIRLAAQSTAQQELLRAAFSDEANGLERDIRDLLAEADVPVSAGLTITIDALDDAILAASVRPFRVELATRKEQVSSPRPPAILKVLRGNAEPAEFSVSSDQANIGRTKEVIGEKEGLRRRNDLAFADTETTVSREHAFIRYDPPTGRFRIYDSGSQRGTIIFRGGRRLDVPKGAHRGTQLQSGDEIHLGEARIRFDILD
jgi:hypothetical protein